MTEENLRRALILSGGSWRIFVEHPIAATLLALAMASIAFSWWQSRRATKTGGVKR